MNQQKPLPTNNSRSQPQNNNVNRVVNQQAMQLSSIQEIFRKNEAAIRDALPKHLDPDRMLRISLTELRNNPKLLDCDPLSFLGACVKASQLGLEPGSALGQCFLIPYGRECQFQMGYKGLMMLVRRSREVRDINADIIFKGDIWRVRAGTAREIEHEPRFESEEMTHVYAVARMPNKGVEFKMMSLAQVEAHRQQYSKMPNSPAWKNSFNSMAKKTVLIQVVKYLPQCAELQEAMFIEQNTPDLASVIDKSRDPDAPTTTVYEAEAQAVETDERKIAEDDFGKAMESFKSRGGTPGDFAKLFGKDSSPDQICKEASTDALMSCADVLNDWKPAK